ncbi:MAG: signal peptidase I [Alphaproteobacteria bacterium]|nr:signal peptidase I [Alphaproteobacteria bacterium]
MSSPVVSKSGGFLDTVRTVIYAVLIALVIRTLLFEPFNIPSGSMIPNLLIGDYLFVSKYSYGYSRHSLPFSPPVFSGRILSGSPERGDVAVFKLPRDSKTDYIKRIIGLPGDRIQVIKGVLHVNGQPVRRERIEDFAYDEGGRTVRVPQYVETLPNGRKHRIIEIQGDQGGLDNTDIYIVPPGQFFAMGDNRDNSQDSRVLSAVGFVPAENLVGKAQILFFSHNGSASFWQVWKWPGAIRFTRLFRSVD